MHSASITETVTGALRADLLACRLGPGAKLKIADLAARLGASPGAIREALSRLTAEGLVVAEAQRGFRAAPVSLDDLAQLTEARILLETTCLKESIAHADVEWEAGVIAAFHLLSRQGQMAPDTAPHLQEDWKQAHRLFHDRLAANCRNEWLLKLRKSLAAQAERYHCLSVQLGGASRDALGEHRELMEASLNGEVELAAALLSRHMRLTTEILMKAPQLQGNAVAGRAAAEALSRASPVAAD